MSYVIMSMAMFDIRLVRMLMLELHLGFVSYDYVVVVYLLEYLCDYVLGCCVVVSLFVYMFRWDSYALLDG